MLTSRIRRFLTWAFVLGIFTSGTLGYAQTTGGIQGSTKDEKGNPLVGYPILIERQDIRGEYKTKTNKKGEFIYIGLPIGNYKVTLQDPSGHPLTSLTNHVGLGDYTQYDFDLAEMRKQQMTNPENQKILQEQAKQKEEMAGLTQLFNQGVALYDGQKYPEAAAAFEKAVPLAKGHNLQVVLQREADSYAKAKQFDKALDAFQKAIELNPSDSDLHNGLGNVYAEMGKIPEAQAEFQKSADLNPSGASRAFYNLGVVMYNTGKMDEAAAAFKKASDADPTYADAFFMQGRALMGKLTLGPNGEVIAAPGTSEALQTYLKLQPNGKYAADAQGMLQTIQGTVQTEVKVEKKKKKKQ